MANQTASPEEAEVARGMLARLAEKDPPRHRGGETPRVLSREAIFGTPDRTTLPPRGVRIRYPSGTWIHMNEDEVDWQIVENHRMPYRWDGEVDINYPKGLRRELDG